MLSVFELPGPLNTLYIMRYLFWLWIVYIPGNIWAQDRMLKAPVVEIEAGGQPGAGILVGNRGSTLYIVTAYHVVADAPDELRVYFYPSGTIQAPARIVQTNSRFDLAVIQCTQPSGYQLSVSYSMITSLPSFRQEVTVIGHPSGDRWMTNVSNRVNGQEYEGDDRFFTTGSQGLAGGNSGGPVLDEQNRLLGMVQEVDFRKAVCISSGQIRRSLQSWGIPTNLLSGVSSISSSNIRPRPQTPQNYTDSYLGTEMIYVAGGSFSMGSNEVYEDEKPIHRVQVPAFYLGKYEVTQAQWRKVMGSNPSDNKDCDQCPVEQVSWNDIQTFLRKLNAQSSYTYRLPTEAEWEYAAGGGATSRTRYAGTNEESQLYRYANFCDVNCTRIWKTESQNDKYARTAPVGRLSPQSTGSI